jgi:hypothetical protein
VEAALSNYELALLGVHDAGMRAEPIYFIGNEDDSNQTSIVDLLVAALTEVPRHLMQCCYHNIDMTGSPSTSNLPKQIDTNFVASMEHICYRAQCISANLLMKWFCQGDNNDAPLLEERHISAMIDEVAAASDDDTFALFVEPIITVVNFMLEQYRIESSIYDGEGDNGCFQRRNFFSNLSAKDGLLLSASLMERFICQHQGNAEAETSSHISLFISSLLEHFRDMVLAETESNNRFRACHQYGRRKFEVWADASNEHMERNLNDDEVSNIPTLLSQYHVQSIESALELLESAESLMYLCGENDNVESIITIVQDTIRASMIAISTTETMEILDMMQSQNPEIFYPLIESFTKFILSGLQNALHFMRKVNSSHDIEGIIVIADDLLFRLCSTSTGLEFFKRDRAGDKKEILALVLLRAMSAGCVQSKAKVLLDLASESARNVNEDGRPTFADDSSKRQRIDSSLSFGNRNASSAGIMQIHSTSRSMIDVILCCLSLSQCNRGDDIADQTHIKELSCITSALVFSGNDNEDASNDSAVSRRQVVDAINPWHSLQLKPLMQIISNSNETNDMMEPLIAYTSTLPPCADITSSVLEK